MAFSQNTDRLKGYDYVYLPNIRSVKFHLEGLFLSYPVVDLNSDTPLVLSFDDTDGDVKDYTYDIVHCDADWQPSQLSEMEYLQGFSGERIDQYDFSFKTISEYTHYELRLPNNQVSWTKSGNYLLLIYEDEGQRRPAIVRRFMVVEPYVRIEPQLVRPAQVSKLKTHHEIDFEIAYEELDIRNPRTEVSAAVLQNGRWDNAITGIKPQFTRIRSLIFDYQDKIVFPAGKEFRFVDLRSLRSRGENVSTISFDESSGFSAVLYKDRKRFNQPFTSRRDLNGGFVINNLDDIKPQLSANYVETLFTLYSPSPYYDYDVYLFGAFTDWRIQEDYRLEYSDRVKGYVGQVPLKQGRYDYVYAVVPRNQKRDQRISPDIAEVEGNWHQTENNYTILIYYRPFGGRYDRLIGARTFNTTP